MSSGHFFKKNTERLQSIRGRFFQYYLSIKSTTFFMQNKFQKSFVLYILLLFSFRIDEKKLQEKLVAPPPAWMEEQIQEDLAKFKGTGITFAMIERTMQEVDALPHGYAARFVLYSFHNNVLSCTSPHESLAAAEVTHFMAFLQEAARFVTFPDIDFLLSTWDCYDNPTYLEHTFCPVFCISKMEGNTKVALIPWLFYYDYKQRQMEEVYAASNKSPWDLKTPIALWRGVTSGNYYPWYEWDFKVRPRLVLFSKERPDLLDAAFTGIHFIDDKLKALFEEYDFFRPYTHPAIQLHHKYLVAADGNAFPGSFQWQLLSNSVVLRHPSPFSEWFYKALQPYVHYVPYAQDMSDFEDVLIWLRAHDKEAKTIADTATTFAINHLMIEDVIVYYYRLFQAYAALYRH